MTRGTWSFVIFSKMSLVFLPGRLGMLVRHKMSRRFGGLDMAISIFWKLSCPLSVSLYISCIEFFLISRGWYCQWMWIVSSDGTLCCSNLLSPWMLSMEAAADRIMGIMSSIWWPLWISRWMNNWVIWMKSSAWVFWFQYRIISPVINPLKQLEGWAEVGGIYRYRLSGFWNDADF